MINITETNATYNNNRIYNYSYEFDVNGERICGDSYDILKDVEINDRVEVEYISHNSSISRIIGSTNGSFPIWTLFFISIFLFIGILLLFVPMRGSKRLINILNSDFELLTSTLVNKWRIPFVRINNYQSLYRFEFSYSKNNETYKKIKYSIKTNKFVVDSSYDLIVNPSKLEDSYIFESLPRSVKRYLNEKCTVADNA